MTERRSRTICEYKPTSQHLNAGRGNLVSKVPAGRLPMVSGSAADERWEILDCRYMECWIHVIMTHVSNHIEFQYILARELVYVLLHI